MFWGVGDCCTPISDPPGPPKITPCANCDEVYQCYKATVNIAGACCTGVKGVIDMDVSGTCRFDSVDRCPLLNTSGACTGGTASWPLLRGFLSNSSGNPLAPKAAWVINLYWYTQYLFGGSTFTARHYYQFQTPTPVAANSCLNSVTTYRSTINFNDSGGHPGTPPQPCSSVLTSDSITIEGAFCESDPQTGSFAIAGSNTTFTLNAP